MSRSSTSSGRSPSRSSQSRARADRTAIETALLGWYDAHRRDLPWRRTRDPYAIWVSEMMLQQTQVKTAVDYYARWMKRFPTVTALASASESDVLHAWQGLGYYRRAKNLLRAAEAVVRHHEGRLPNRVDELVKLPGIGAYSAGAISSIAYGEREPVVDGNVVRVLCRLLALRGDPTRAPLKKTLWQHARDLVSDARPGDFNQALMELGATVCTPREPSCNECPLRTVCAARRTGTAARLPELPRRKAVVRVARAAAVVLSGSKALCVRVPATARRFSGMWEFPNADVRAGETVENAAERAVLDAAGVHVTAGKRCATILHSVTHHRITLEVVICRLRGRSTPRTADEARWIPLKELPTLAMPAPHRRISHSLSK